MNLLDKLKMSGRTRKKQYDHKIVHKIYDGGTPVWFHNPKPKKGLHRKLQSDWCGTFIITHRLNDIIYRIQETQRSKSKEVHHNKLKLYTDENVPTWFQRSQ